MRARGFGGGRACAADKSVGAAGAGLCVCACESATSRKKSCIPGVASLSGATPARGAEGDTEASVLKRGADPAAKRAAPGLGCSCVACAGPSPRRGDPYKAAIHTEFQVNTAQLA